MKWIKWFFYIAIATLFVVTASFVVWTLNPLGPMPEAMQALESTTEVTVSQDPWLIFTPDELQKFTGIIIYPGARVDPRSYAPIAHAIANEGYLAVITPMPLNMAFFAPGKAAQVMDYFPEINRWIIGGHSLGGAMAASFTHDHPDQVAGLTLWAAYPANNDDLSRYTLNIKSIYASNDGLATPDEVLASSPRLPADTVWTLIQGGNHAQFGWYGDQPGDKPAEISRSEQQQQMLAAILVLLSNVENNPP
jgi:dienelactone hydrolase